MCVHNRLMVGAPLQHQPSNNGTIQPTGAVYTCLLTEDDDGKCSLLNHTSFYTFNGNFKQIACIIDWYANNFMQDWYRDHIFKLVVCSETCLPYSGKLWWCKTLAIC